MSDRGVEDRAAVRGRGWLFPNDKKETDKQPDRLGHGEVRLGMIKKLYEEASKLDKDPESFVKISIAAWDKVSVNSGNPYMFVTLEVDDRRRPAERDDDVPF